MVNPMFRRILIANRGEIAVRVIRACRDMGIVPIAVYSEPDRTSLHVRMADEAYPLGPAPSIESYLNINKVLDAARQAQADAIHPGYGFLSENPRFADACANAGIPLIGPSAESMRMMGGKVSARALLQKHGIPVVPGTYRALGSIQEAVEEARKLEYPVMIKASAGGGGKGMRFVASESRMSMDFTAAAEEALNSFGDSSLYLEKYLVSPRHIEFQVLADKHGNTIHLGERECSIQRRHQKIMEECPSPFLDEKLRREMGEVAVRVLRISNYVNAGTIEFLVTPERKFYFLEMNTRLQVEHPVTELVTGVDMVCEQIRIAAGEQLSLRQKQVQMQGWALECRICAEDPQRLFPSTGVIKHLQEPAGPGIRLDSGIYQGWGVTIHYDPLLAKLVAFGSNREQAIVRMTRALQEYRISGVKTNLPFFPAILSDPDFLAGNIHTGFLEELQKKESKSLPKVILQSHAVAAALAYADSTEGSPKPESEPESPWKLSGYPGFSIPPRR
jgi:acetyl-CoA carboxylase, biotin carboxylase subunit